MSSLLSINGINGINGVRVLLPCNSLLEPTVLLTSRALPISAASYTCIRPCADLCAAQYQERGT